MARPQKGNGYVGIANELWDEVIRRDFTKRQKDILLFIWRLSYGCGQKVAVVPKQKDFALCGVGETNVGKELRYLERCKVIFRNRETDEYQFNKDYDFWQINPGRDWDDDRFKELLHINLKEAKKTRSKLIETISLTPDEQEEELIKTISLDDENLSKQEDGLIETISLTPDFPIQGKASETPKKGLKKKVIKKEDIYIHLEDMPHVNITQKHFNKLVVLLGDEKKVMNQLYSFASWIITQSDKKQKTASPYLSIVNWHNKESDKVPLDAKRKLPMDARKSIPLII